jgi:dipeptidyl aminopeptidase/acylaminoacyl peptidase
MRPHFAALLLVVLASGCRPSAPAPAASKPAPPPPPLPKPGRIGRDVRTYNVLIPHREGSTRAWIYLPVKRPKGKKLPLVLIAPAGTRGFDGMALGDGDVPEHVPYAKAGFAVAAYELWGPISESASDAEAASGMRAYMTSDGGLVNARAALDYALTRLPIDGKRIYAAGHSSAATVALSVAAREPRIKACVAYAPATDLPARFSDGLSDLESLAPGFRSFVQRISPAQNASKLRCPVFLFHALDDSVVAPAESTRFAAQLRAHNRRVELVTVPTGEHYDSMVRQGIPRAIRWLKRL